MDIRANGGEQPGSRSKSEQLRFTAAVVMLCLLWMAGQFDLQGLLSPIHWSIVCLLVGLAPAAFSLYRVRFDSFQPICPMMAYLGLLFGARGVYLLSASGSKWRMYASDRQLAQTLTLALLGTSALYGGYFCGVGDRLARHLPRLRLLAASERSYPRSVIALAGLLGVAGVALHALLMAGVIAYDVSSFGGTFWVTLLSNLLPAGMSLLFLNGEGRKRRFGRTVAMVVLYAPVCVSFALFSGKSTLLQPFFYLLVIFHYQLVIADYRRCKLDAVVWPVFVLGFVAVQVASLWGFAFDWSLPRTEAYVVAHSHSCGDVWELLFSRFYGLDAFTVVQARVQHSGVLLGRSYGELLYWFVPRFLWPAKPLGWSYGWGQVFAFYAGRYKGAFVAPTLFGDFYLNFGLCGLLVGSGAVGVVARITYIYLVKLIGTRSAVVLYPVVLFHLIIGLEQSFPAAVELAATEVASVAFLLAISRALWCRRDREAFAWLASAYPDAVFGPPA